MTIETKTQFKIIGLIIGIALIVFNVYFYFQLTKIKTQLNTNTENIGKVVQFINASIKASQEN